MEALSQRFAWTCRAIQEASRYGKRKLRPSDNRTCEMHARAPPASAGRAVTTTKASKAKRAWPVRSSPTGAPYAPHTLQARMTRVHSSSSGACESAFQASAHAQTRACAPVTNAGPKGGKCARRRHRRRQVRGSSPAPGVVFMRHMRQARGGTLHNLPRRSSATCDPLRRLVQRAVCRTLFHATGMQEAQAVRTLSSTVRISDAVGRF